MDYDGKMGEIGLAGFEPARDFSRRILSPLRLPFRHKPIIIAPTGLEPALLSERGPKPRASANSATEPNVMWMRGFEPPLPFGNHHLKVARLPFRHTHVVNDPGRI